MDRSAVSCVKNEMLKPSNVSFSWKWKITAKTLTEIDEEEDKVEMFLPAITNPCQWQPESFQLNIRMCRELIDF